MKMSQINITIDTEKDSMAVDVGGKKMKDVQEVRAYVAPWDDDSIHVEIISGNMDEENGIKTTIITTVAGEKIETKEDKCATEGILKALKIFG